MKNKELMFELAKFDPEMEVQVGHDNGELYLYNPIQDIDTGSISNPESFQRTDVILIRGIAKNV